MENNKYRIDSTEMIFLVSAALAVDALQALLNFLLIGAILNRIISPLAFLSFWRWFRGLDVSFSKKMTDSLPFAIGFLIEFIPFLDLLPATTGAVVLTILKTRAEDGQKTTTKKKPAVTAEGKKPIQAPEEPADKKESAGQNNVVDSGVRPKPDAAGQILLAAQSGQEAIREEQNASSEPDTEAEQKKSGTGQSEKKEEKENEAEKNKLTEPGADVTDQIEQKSSPETEKVEEEAGGEDAGRPYDPYREPIENQEEVNEAEDDETEEEEKAA